MLTRRIIGAIMVTGFATCASASTVEVIVINNSTEVVALRPASKNERNTVAHASPTLPQSLKPGQRAAFRVAPYITNDVNFAAVRYHSRRRSCAFLTSYVNMRTRLGSTPQWNHKAQGGSNCTSRIVYQNPYTHDWAVEFTIR